MAGTEMHGDIHGDITIPEEVFSAFNLQVERLEQVRKAIKVFTPDGSYALKQVIPSKEKAKFTSRVVEYLHNNGFKAAVPIIATKNGELLHIQGDTGYVLSPWIEGREADFESWEDLVLAADIMGRLHKASTGFHIPEGEWARNVLGKWPLQWNKALEELSKCLEGPVEPSLRFVFQGLRPILSDLLSQGRKAVEMLEARGNYRQQVERTLASGCLCHRDLVHHNLIIDRFGQVNIIDFEYCAQDLPVSDVGRFLRKVLPDTDWDWQKMKELLKVYQRVYPLTIEDRWLLLASLTFPHTWWRLVRRAKDGTWSLTRLKHQLHKLIQGEQARQLLLCEMTRELD